MATITINDQQVEIEPGERLLDAARRHAVHIGFVCDGHGLCQMCECRIIKGHDQLSPTTEPEETWLTQAQLKEGRRLACQTAIRGPGPVEVLTRAEELRRQTNAVFNPPKDDETDRQEHITRLINSLVTINIEHLKRFPMNMMYTLVHVLTLRPTISGFQHVLSDCVRISNRLATGKEPEVKPAGQEQQQAKAPALAPAKPQPQPQSPKVQKPSGNPEPEDQIAADETIPAGKMKRQSRR